MTLNQLAQKVKIKTVYGKAPSNEDFPHYDNWLVTLKYQQRQMTVPFYSNSEPTSQDVLECLLSNSSVEQYGRADDKNAFEEWASDCGYHPGSGRARTIWK